MPIRFKVVYGAFPVCSGEFNIVSKWHFQFLSSSQAFLMFTEVSADDAVFLLTQS